MHSPSAKLYKVTIAINGQHHALSVNKEIKLTAPIHAVMNGPITCISSLIS